MSVAFTNGVEAIAGFVVETAISEEARQRAAIAFIDTCGVMLAGAGEPAARIAQSLAAEEGVGDCRVVGTSITTSPALAAFANGVAAHALDYDDMCFVSLAHPSCVLVPALLAAGEITGAHARTLLDAYVVGFEIECRLGIVMNPRHYHQRGWHCTSSIGTIGAAAAVARVLGLDVVATRHALGIAASSACGLKENMGSMVKPLHAGMAARNGVTAAQLARRGFTASPHAIDGPQGYLAAMDSEHASLSEYAADLGSRWEIVDTGITVKLYPSCAGTHPTLDALLDLKRCERFGAGDVESIDVGVDAIVPTILIYDRPATGLEAKFSMPFCAAAAIVDGRVGIDTFEAAKLADPAIAAVQSRVTMQVDPTLDASAPALTQARVTVRLKDGRMLTASADGARGYPEHPASRDELAAKFLACASRVLPVAKARLALKMVSELESVADVRALFKS